MQDAFITAVNAQKNGLAWFELLTENMSNIYTPGYREVRGGFESFMNGSDINELDHKQDQTKSIPGTSPENIFLEGKGFVAVRKQDGTLMYTRLGDFKFDGKGTYATKDGYKVQGYILDKSGNIMNTGSGGSDPNNPSLPDGGPANLATTEINMWIDPSNGKYLGKYDEWKIEGNGIIYGKNEKGNVKDPLYKISIVNFHNSESLTMPEEGFFTPNDRSGEPVAAGNVETRSGLLEKSNVDFRFNIHKMQEAKLMLSLTNKIISTNKTLLEESLRLIQ